MDRAKRGGCLNDLNINTGTILFQVAPNTLEYDDNKVGVFINELLPDGVIQVIKDRDNLLKFDIIPFASKHIHLGVNISDLSSNEAHDFAFTWDTKKTEVKIYVDGTSVAGAKWNMGTIE